MEKVQRNVDIGKENGLAVKVSRLGESLVELRKIVKPGTSNFWKEEGDNWLHARSYDDNRIICRWLKNKYVPGFSHDGSAGDMIHPDLLFKFTFNYNEDKFPTSMEFIPPKKPRSQEVSFMGGDKETVDLMNSIMNATQIKIIKINFPPSIEESAIFLENIDIVQPLIDGLINQ